MNNANGLSTLLVAFPWTNVSAVYYFRFNQVSTKYG